MRSDAISGSGKYESVAENERAVLGSTGAGSASGADRGSGRTAADNGNEDD